MNIKKSIINNIPKADDNFLSGEWRTIRYLPDLATEEFFNVGVMFNNGSMSGVKMLDNFDRLECLYGKAIDEKYLTFLFEEIEEYFLKDSDVSNNYFGEHITFSNQRYAAGRSSSEILQRVYDDVVTLSRVKERSKRVFRYISTPKLRNEVFDIMRQKMALKASEFIQNEPFQIRLKSGGVIPVNIPLVGSSSVGAVVSSYYKSPLVAGHSVLTATTALSLAIMNDIKSNASLSILRPGNDSGLTKTELVKVNKEVDEHLKTAEALGIEILDGITTAEVSVKTCEWWGKAA